MKVDDVRPPNTYVCFYEPLICHRILKIKALIFLAAADKTPEIRQN